MPEMDGLTAMREIRKRPEWKQAADHRADRQGDEGRPGEVPRRRRQRLHRQAARRREAAVARARLDAEVDDRWPSPDFDIELQLLLEAIYLQVPLRLPRLRDGVAQAAAARGDGRASAADACRSCRTACCTSPTLFPALLDFLTVQVSEMFRDPAYFRALRERWCRCCAPIRRSRSGSPAAAPAKRSIRWRSCCARRGCSSAR